MKYVSFACAAAWITTVVAVPGIAGGIPVEPVEIGTTPQFFVDDYIVDNRWALKYSDGSKEMVTRVLHQPIKHKGNPVLEPFRTFNETDPTKVRSTGGYIGGVTRDPQTGLFRMWYGLHIATGSGWGRQQGDRVANRIWDDVIAYAESEDGLTWRIPDVHPDGDPNAPDRNVVWRGTTNRYAHAPFILDIPETARRGYRYVMLYLDRPGMCLVGSPDGRSWDSAGVVRIAKMHSDTANCIVYDPARDEFVMYCRAKQIYRVRSGEVIDVGESRRIARMTSPELWTEWQSDALNILIPDELDAASSWTAFYGMTAKVHAGIYWGFLQPFKWNTDIESQLAFSRDGIDFDRLPYRPNLIERGPNGAWDDGMVKAAPGWVEVGDEWWLYYGGSDGPHGMNENRAAGYWRTTSFGLTRARREGFISMRGPDNGGVIVTRKLRWPGGGLLVNSNAKEGVLRVRVTDGRRNIIPGYDYEDCEEFSGDATRHEMKWNEQTLRPLAGQIIRLEFFLQKADIYTFVSGGK